MIFSFSFLCSFLTSLICCWSLSNCKSKVYKYYLKLILKDQSFFSKYCDHSLGAMPGRSKAKLYKLILSSLQGAIWWSHEGFRYFLIKYWYLSWWKKFCFDLILYIPFNNFSVMSGLAFQVWTSTKQGLMCLAQGQDKCSDAGEIRTHNPSISRQALYHWATRPTTLPKKFSFIQLSPLLQPL